MALVSSGFDLRVNLVDSGEDQSSLSFVLEAASAAAAATAAGTIMGLLAAVSGLVISSYSITERFVESALVLPVPQYQSEQKAKIVARIAGEATKTHVLYIPGPLEGIFVAPGHNDVNISNTDLIAWVDIWRLTGALASISDGEYLADSATIKSGERVHRQSSRG